MSKGALWHRLPTAHGARPQAHAHILKNTHAQSCSFTSRSCPKLEACVFSEALFGSGEITGRPQILGSDLTHTFGGRFLFRETKRYTTILRVDIANHQLYAPPILTHTQVAHPATGSPTNRFPQRFRRAAEALPGPRAPGAARSLGRGGLSKRGRREG